MNEISSSAPLSEQRICVSCGMCCDGTLFLHAHLEPVERGNLPEMIEKNSYSKEGKDYFKLPCLYFSEKCTIYDRKRAYVCGSFRCRLLKDFAEGKLTHDDALEVVKGATDMRAVIMGEYKKLSGNDEAGYFKELLRALGRMQESATEGKPLGLEYDMLIARCNIFEALLIKHFRSAEDFDKMIMK